MRDTLRGSRVGVVPAAIWRPPMPISVRFGLACVLAIWTVTAAAPGIEGLPAAAPSPGLYHANPNYLWNRVHRLFHVRVAPDGTEYGSDSRGEHPCGQIAPRRTCGRRRKNCTEQADRMVNR